MPATMMLKEIANYPVEDRIMMADAIIESLNGSNPEIDAAWNAVSRRRLGELRTGKVKGIPAATVPALTDMLLIAINHVKKQRGKTQGQDKGPESAVCSAGPSSE